MATPQVKDLVLRSPAGSSEVVTFSWPLQIGNGQDAHDNGIDILDTIKFVCDELPSISSAFEEINLNQIDTACYKTMTNLVDRFNKAVDSIVALEKGTSLPAERLNKFAHPSLLRHILQLVYNAAVLDPDKLNNYEPFSPEVYGETSYELVQQMIKHVNVSNEDTFIDLGSGVGQVVLQMAGSFPLKTCIGIEKADTPAHYAERMDIYFRQFMAWFGKRYCEYKLIKGDFLVDEHREKITSSTLVFVNNFAFGPNVDHQLKERFADLRDGARIVSSKSFCPLNFRITDRNLSDIGTIMHVSEIPPLKGSVSWTCKPVSYYLHVIDRTILERYFQRLKTQKGAENDHVGSARTTRDRAKREANNHTLSNSNSNSSIVNNRTNSPANVNNNTAASKTKQPQPLQTQTQPQPQPQQTPQRNMDIDTSTESDGDTTTNGTNLSNGTGPTTRKIWSDWCSSKGKSSQSDDEENNNFSSTTNSRSARNTTQKKRKKLTRKAAIANKSAAAAQREAAARERAEAAALAANSKESSSKEDNAGSGAASNNGLVKGRKGRMKKGGGRGRKSLKIVGLDVLHKQTLLSTSVEKMSKKLPPAPGCVDQQLTSLLTGNMSHMELDIPEAPQHTPYGLQILLDVIRTQYMGVIDQMKSPSFVPRIQQQIKLERERKERIKNRALQLDKQIKVLIDDSVALLKVRMNELGIDVTSSTDLIAKAKEIVSRHKELQNTAKKMQSQVTVCEIEEKRLIKMNLQILPEFQKLNGRTKHEMHSGHNSMPEFSESKAQDLVLKEIWNTLSQRKKLSGQIDTIEQETAALEKVIDERRTAAALLAQGTNMTLANVVSSASTNPSLVHLPVTAAHVANGNALQPLQLTTNNNNFALNSGVPNNVTSSKSSSHVKNSRRSRDHRTRSQDWPDVPDVGKIEESNPEVLAQKILETGRQIEAGKFTTTLHNRHNSQHHEDKRTYKHQRNTSNDHLSSSIPTAYNGPQDSTLMPAPNSAKNQHVAASNSTTPAGFSSSRSSAGLLPKCELPGLRKSALHNNGIQESPKVANFEDRLKSIITSALNEDQEHRKAASHQLPNGVHIHEAPAPAQQPPTPKRSKQSSTAASAHHLPPPHTPSNLNNIITVATQGLTHLNSTTTISPVTPPLLPGATGPSNMVHHSKYGKQQSVTSSAISAQKYTAKESISNSSKYQHHASAHQQQQNMLHLQPQALFPNGPNTTPTDLAFARRQRNSISAASLEQFAAQQQQAMMMAAAAASQHQHHAQGQTVSSTHHNHILPLEFKAPTTAENLITAAHRSSSRELIDDVMPRSSSANSDSAVMYFPPTRDRLMSHERSISRESATSQSLQQHQQPPRPNSRPNSNSSQPDYTQVSPAKMALRRHLSQEKLNQVLPAAAGNNSGMPMSTKTIGDLVNGEIERTLEISHQSIINAVVNMSTVGTPSGIDRTHFIERNLFAERERANERFHDRMLINPNAQRPERVHVRLLDEQSGNMHASNNFSNALDISARSKNSGRKSPVAHNLATLAHVAYNHKPISASTHDTHTTATTRNSNSRNNNNVSNTGSYQLPAITSRRESISKSNATASDGNTRSREYQPVALPRAEMKGCIEAYFNDEHQQQSHQLINQQQQQQHRSSSSKDRNNGRMGRLNNGNPPLEGLAASLQDHMMATRKFKEENEERQRRAALVAATSNDIHHHSQQQNIAHQFNHITPTEHHQYRNTATPNTQTHNGSPIKVEVGLKRTSPMTNTQPRPNKIPHYSQEPISTTHHHSHQQLQQLNNNSNSNSNSNSAHNSYANTNGGLHISLPSPSPSPSSQISRRNKLPIEPLLMSPEINSIMGDERPLQLSSRHQQSQRLQSTSITPIISGRSVPDDDDGIADDETHWQHRVSSGFDRLVAFASTELDKTRRSIDNDNAPSSISCNTSPDSGITHSSTNSDIARTFLSTSSTSSQLDMPIGSSSGSGSSSSASSSGSSYLHHLHHVTDHLSDSSMKSSHSDATSLPITIKTSPSPVDPNAIDSPPLSDIGLPRTPSPNAAVATPPLASTAMNAVTTQNIAHNDDNSCSGNSLKIPLKYQRKFKSSSEKHYKKKFCERNWEYDCDELSYSNNSSNSTMNSAGTTKSAINMNLKNENEQHRTPPHVKSNRSPKDSTSLTSSKDNERERERERDHQLNNSSHHYSSSSHHHHKSSKFRPKGKDWDWSMDSNVSNCTNSNGSSKIKTELTATTTTTNVN